MEEKQPGVMLYFDIRPCLARLTMDEQGMLFNAILNYGENGIEPDFEYMLGVAWDFIKPRLERDRLRYADKVRKSRYAVYIRECKQNGLPPLDMETWDAAGQPMPSDKFRPYQTALADMERHRAMSDDIG